jgi:TM2 domain-containing membrane protein YozV
MSDRYSGNGGRDTAAMMRFEANKRSALIAYALWCLLFLGFFGIHRMYLGRVLSGILMLLLGWLCVFFTWASFGLLFLVWVLPGLWALIDLLLIPGMTRSYNEDLIRRLT